MKLKYVHKSPLHSREKPPRPVTLTLPQASRCKHWGRLLDRTACGLEVYSCKKHGTCSYQPQAMVRTCDTCSDWQPSATWRSIIIDKSTYFTKAGGERYNASMIPWRGGYLLAYRCTWPSANVEVGRLGPDFEPLGEPVFLRLSTRLALEGREDPRLFIHQGVPHVSYVGWQGGWSNDTIQATVHYARLNPDTLEVENKWAPEIPWRKSWEKNHSYFDRAGELFAVYSINPHIVMLINGNTVQDHWATAWDAKESQYGAMRGGASPVLHNHEWYHFFHYMAEAHGQRLYSIGVVTFQADPPFRVRRITRHPIDVADRNAAKPIDVLFPCGAFIQGGQWIVTMGVHDFNSQIRFYPESYIEQALTPAE